MPYIRLTPSGVHRASAHLSRHRSIPISLASTPPSSSSSSSSTITTPTTIATSIKSYTVLSINAARTSANGWNNGCRSDANNGNCITHHPSISATPIKHYQTTSKKHLNPTTSLLSVGPSPLLGNPYNSAREDERETNDIPDFSKYKSEKLSINNSVFQYFMVGTFGAVSALGAKNTVQDFLVNMSASADVLAMAKVEVDLNSIPESSNVTIKWRGKPVFIRHRSSSEIEEASKVEVASLRDPETDDVRVKRPEWLVMLGVCTHLGCVPIGEAGDYNGWFCPCHGSHYDISGRIRKGPAPLNLEIPEYEFADDSTLIIG